MWIKICGIQDCETARWIGEVGPDAIGLNFFPRSRRYVEPQTAAAIAEILPDQIERVGLFVNAPVTEIARIAEQCRLTTLQLHGDETVDDLVAIREACPGPLLMRALRCGPDGLEQVAQTLQQASRCGLQIDRCLLDAAVSGEYGGTGHRAPWDVISRDYCSSEWPPLVLAGGLHPGNVAAAIAAVRPWGVDVASGVEAPAGIKDRELCRQFVEAARQSNVG